MSSQPILAHPLYINLTVCRVNSVGSGDVTAIIGTSHPYNLTVCRVKTIGSGDFVTANIDKSSTVSFCVIAILKTSVFLKWSLIKYK